ncbi:MAG TPA: DHA2 family efflux MFS transporter permease subunit, partial [Rubrobacteraceae bacterium]|nr:DHA2 family efflux MFS transporter permease subunit [Rubrobacteraceae bacterium]
MSSTSERRRWIALYVLCIGMLMIVLDATVVNVALPSIQEDLGFSQSGLAWVVNAYLISFGGLLLLAGRLGDLVSRRGVFLAGIGVFTVASLVCGVARSQEMLVAARFVQGVGGAMTSAVILGMIVTMFPGPREQARAIGVFAFVASAGGAVGLLVGGVLTQSISWHWIFFVNVPVGVATAVLARRLIEPDKGIGFGHGADVPGAVLITSALMLGVYTIVEPAADLGWGAGRTLTLGVLSLLLLAAFIAREATARSPLMPLGIFRSRNVAGANVIQVLSVAGMFGMFFLGALYLQRILAYDALETGLAFLPVTIIMGTLSVRYTDRLVMRFGARTMVLGGLALFMVGLALFTRAPVGGGYVIHVFPVMVLLGTGAGLCFPALMTLAMSGVTTGDAGLASGLINTTAQVGGALGLAVLATLSASRSSELIRDGQ